MKREYSLRAGADFQRVWDSGKSWTHPLIALRARGNGLNRKRFGFVVGKKIGKAVERNRVKRWMREAVQGRVEQLPAGWDLVFIARAKTGVEFGDVDAAVAQVLKNARLLESSR